MAGLRLEQSLRTRLTTEQRLALKQLFQLRQELVTAPPPEAKRGLEGIGEANKILTQKRLKGLLIGSLAADFWKTGDAQALAQHKDVDVAVLQERDKEIDIDLFEGGIDWWLPQTQELEVKEAFASIKGRHTWWENGNGVVIGAGLETYSSDDLPPGLYIPSPQTMIDLRVAELMARIDDTRVTVDDSALDALHTRLDKELNPGLIEGNGIIALTQFAAYRFQLGVKNIPTQKFEQLFITGKNIRELAAINSRKQREPKD